MAAISLFCSQYSHLMSSENGPWAESITAYVVFMVDPQAGCFLRETTDLLLVFSSYVEKTLAFSLVSHLSRFVLRT